jgi:hypothetical protein
MAKSTPLFVGLDVHKDSIAVAHATGGQSEPPVFVGAIGTRQADLDRLIRRITVGGDPIHGYQQDQPSLLLAHLDAGLSLCTTEADDGTPAANNKPLRSRSASS